MSPQNVHILVPRTHEYAILLNTKMELRLGVTLKLLLSFFLTLFKNQVNTYYQLYVL